MTMTANDWTAARRKATRQGWNSSWIRSARDVHATLDGCWFDEEASQHVVDFFGKFLRHSKGQWAGQPFHLLPWEDTLTLRPLFGWQRPDGTRRFRRGGIWIPKKNGKSTLGAGIELYLLVGDNEPGAEVYTLANDRGQAGIIYTEAANMVRKSPDLSKRLQPVDSRKTIAYPGMNALLQALSADVPTKEGINAHGIIIDELHAMRSRALWDTVAYAGAARRQPLQLSISTAGVYDELSIGWEQYQYAKGVLDDSIHDWAFFALVFEARPKEDWKDPEVHRRANPSYGVTINPATFNEECREAQQSPAKQNAFRRYRLNQWTQQVTRWIPIETWDANHRHEIVEAVYERRRCHAALDLGGVSDISAWVLGFACEDDPEALDLIARFWIPEALLTNPKNPNRERYQQWVDEGFLNTTPGEVTDYDFIEAAILEDAGRFEIVNVRIDRLFQGQQLGTHLVDEGLEVFPMGQGFLSMAAPMKEYERLWLSLKVHHGANPILRWMAENVEVKADAAGNLKIVKPMPMSPRKVDGQVATVMVIDGVTRDDPGTSAYADHDLVVV